MPVYRSSSGCPLPMSTNKPRVNVTVSPEQHSLLLELAKLQGTSASAILRDMLDAATPLLRATVPTLRVAAEDHETALENARRALQPLKFLNLREAADQLDMLDDALRDAQSAASAVPSERGERGQAGKRKRA
jgi:uncharacterized protein (DUF1778 family)